MNQHSYKKKVMASLQAETKKLKYKRGVGRPRLTYKYAFLDVFSYRKLKAKAEALRTIRSDLIKSIVKDLEQLARLDDWEKEFMSRVTTINDRLIFEK